MVEGVVKLSCGSRFDFLRFLSQLAIIDKDSSENIYVSLRPRIVIFANNVKCR